MQPFKGVEFSAEDAVMLVELFDRAYRKMELMQAEESWSVAAEFETLILFLADLKVIRAVKQ